MAKRKRAVKKTARKRAAKQGAKREATLSLQQFRAQVRSRLSRLEREIQSSQATKQLTRMLRDASVQLGKWEAAGEKRWKKLTSKARADALKLVRRIEQTLSPPPPRAPKPKPVATPSVAPRPVPPRPVAPRPPTPSPATPSYQTPRPPIPGSAGGMPPRPLGAPAGLPPRSPSSSGGTPPRGDDGDDLD